MKRTRDGRARLATVAIAAIGLVVSGPAAAQAADTYVDFETGSDVVPCGPIDDPCQSIVMGIDQTTAGATVRVDDRPGTERYTTMGITLADGISLVAEEFVGGDEGTLGDPDTIIEGGDIAIGTPAITVPAGNPAGTIEGFRIRTFNTVPIRLLAPATLIGNVFDEEVGTLSGCLVDVRNSGNTATIGPSNTFVDPTPDTTTQAGVCVTDGAAPVITQNTFTNLNHGVQSAGGNSTISSNLFEGTRGMTSDASIEVSSGAAIKITGNLIERSADLNVGGIYLRQSTGAGAPVVGATLRQNLIEGPRLGVVVNDTEALVSMIGNLIMKTQTGLAMNDTQGDDGGNVDATNLTIADNINEVTVTNADLTLNSSIIGTTGIDAFGAAMPSCTITFSRGPVMTPGGTGCANFQTMAAPGFVNPGGDDYHLAPGSAMIDMGDPNPPGDLDLDFDGQARVTDGNGDGIARRDIGADETATLVLPPATPAAPAAPAGSPVTSTQTPPAAKKCKRKAKKRAATAKKKRCKRKKRK